MKRLIFQFALLILTSLSACAQTDISTSKSFKEMSGKRTPGSKTIDTATFATGCFWCTEAKFQQLKGVKKVISGYEGGHKVNPSYEDVCTGTTGHAEACNIIYNPSEISYDELLSAFFVAHDPTELNRQGNDVGTQYRSAIFYHNKAQKETATYYIGRLTAEKAYKRPIVTQLAPYSTFYKAENYHQNFNNLNPNQGYCKYVLQPELEAFKKVFKNKLISQSGKN